MASVPVSISDVYKRQENIICEFPVTRVEFFIPKWTEMLKPEHPMKAEIIKTASGILDSIHKTGDVRAQMCIRDRVMAKQTDNQVSAVRRAKHGWILTLFFSILAVFYLYPIFLC